MVPTVEKCCCGLTLKTGTIIIGVLAVLGSISGLGGQSFYAAAGEDENPKEVDKDLEKVDVVLSIFLVLVYLLELILSIILIYGANNENARLVKPWIYFSIVSLVLGVIGYLVLVVIAFMAGGVVAGFVTIVITCMISSIYAYFIIVVNSFHRQLLTVTIMPSKV